MKRYKAIKKGFDGKQIRHPGEVFDFDGKPGSWMEEVEAKKEESSDKGPKEKGTESQKGTQGKRASDKKVV
jgi:hypothetical protein